MKTKEWTFTEERPRMNLPAEGPWQHEPDKRQWVTRAGYPGLIVRNSLGALCGYVGVPREHPYYLADYDNCAVDVHGGLTYAAKCFGEICHEAPPWEDNVWWLGFDCSHLGDMIPGMQHARTRIGSSVIWDKDVYRDQQYVTAEVEHLAAQLKEIAGDDPCYKRLLRYCLLPLRLLLSQLSAPLLNACVRAPAPLRPPLYSIRRSATRLSRILVPAGRVRKSQ